jgi:hypothetical protein
VSVDGTVAVLPGQYTYPLCNWLVRNFLSDEWEQYVGYFYTYKPICPELPIPPINPVLTVRFRLVVGSALALLAIIVLVNPNLSVIRSSR